MYIFKLNSASYALKFLLGRPSKDGKHFKIRVNKSLRDQTLCTSKYCKFSWHWSLMLRPMVFEHVYSITFFHKKHRLLFYYSRSRLSKRNYIQTNETIWPAKEVHWNSRIIATLTKNSKKIQNWKIINIVLRYLITFVY